MSGSVSLTGSRWTSSLLQIVRVLTNGQLYFATSRCIRPHVWLGVVDRKSLDLFAPPNCKSSNERSVVFRYISLYSPPCLTRCRRQEVAGPCRVPAETLGSRTLPAGVGALQVPRTTLSRHARPFTPPNRKSSTGCYELPCPE